MIDDFCRPSLCGCYHKKTLLSGFFIAMSTHLRLIACYIALASCCAFLFPLISPDSFRHVFSMRLERSPRLDSAELPSTIRFILLDSTRVSVRIFDIS
jgi:hypothetical protein